MGSHSLLQGVFPTQGSNLGLLHCTQILYCLSQQGSPFIFTYFKLLFNTYSLRPFHRWGNSDCSRSKENKAWISVLGKAFCPKLRGNSILLILVKWKSFSCVRLCDPMDYTLHSPWNSPGQNIGLGSRSHLPIAPIYFMNYIHDFVRMWVLAFNTHDFPACHMISSPMFLSPASLHASIICHSQLLLAVLILAHLFNDMV